jgi:beta-glucanase (GH16 family)
MLPQTFMKRSLNFLLVAVALLVAPSLQAQSTHLVDFNFNDGQSLTQLGGVSYNATGVAFGAVVTNESSPLFSTPNPATNHYLRFTADSRNANLGSGSPNWGGWWAGAELATIGTVYTTGGLGIPLLQNGLPDPAKISLTARVRARGMTSPTGAVVVLRLVGNSDNPNSGQAATLRRVQFRPFFLANSEWTTIGGSFNQLAAKSGTDYNFMTGSAVAKTDTSFKVVAEVVGFAGDGWGFQNDIRVEIDDVKLTIIDRATPNMVVSSFSPRHGVPGTRVTVNGSLFGNSPSVRFGATNALGSGVSVTNGSVVQASVPSNAVVGKITVVNGALQASSSVNFWPTSPTNLLADPTFSILTDERGLHPYWTFFEGARVPNPNNETWAVGEDGSRIAAIPGWEGTPYAGFYQEASYDAASGDFFTFSFRAKLQRDFEADACNVAMRIVEPFTDNNYDGEPDTPNAFTDLNGNNVWDNASVSVDVLPQMLQNGSEWGTYTTTWKVPNTNVLALIQNGKGLIRAGIQPADRSVNTNNLPLESSIFFDNVVLKQQQSSVVGPQISVKVGGLARADGATANLFAPLIGYATAYPIVLQNDGAQALTVSSVQLSGGSFVLAGNSPVTLQPGESRTFTATTEPVSNSLLAGTLKVLSNDKDTADQDFSINLSTTPVALSDDFNSGTAASLGWIPVFNEGSTTFDTTATVSVASGALTLDVDSSDVGYPWSYGAKKVFASPGNIDLLRSSINVSLRAFGKFSGAANNKVEVYLQSLSSSGAPTGKISLGQWIDETTAGADPGVGSYFETDKIADRVAILLPEGGSYTTVQSALSSAKDQGLDQGFDVNAPAFQVVVLMTDFEFDRDAGNIVEIDFLDLTLATQPFEVTNGGFESNSTDFGAGAAPAGWLQFPVEGVSKNLVVNGDAVYSASLVDLDDNVLFTAYAGSKAMKIYAQNYFPGGVWEGPSQTGVVYQEWGVAGTADLSVGQTLHARGVAKVYGIDALTGGSTFRYGFRYMDAANLPVAPDDVTTITAPTATPDQWVPLVANGTVPAGATKVQLIAEFVQNNSTDTGAVYLDDVSVGLGVCPSTKQVGSKTYQLVWSDEFDGSSLNTANWTPEIGTGNNGWGNGEAQYYTDRPENLRVENGHLVIEAIKENYQGSRWTSARIQTQDKRNFKYGKFEFRAKLPSGVGPWPAAWMLGSNISTVGWPQCGEIDVMEWRGTFGQANTVGHALHSSARHGGNPVEPAERTPVSNPSTEFHTYAVVWNHDSFIFSVDGVDVATLTPPAADAEVFRKEFFLLLNLAMGGVYNGYEIDPSLTGATYEVDYVRVYQDPDGNNPTDTTPPLITILGANPVSLPWGNAYSDSGATALDAGDNASVHVATVNPVDPSVPGDYWVTYTAQDSTGNSTNTNRLVNVIMANNGNNVGADGLTDSLRYALGGTGPDPLPSAYCPSIAITPGTNGTKNLVMTYFARTNANVSLLPWASANLASSNGWTTNGIVVTVLSNVATNGTLLEKRQATTPATGSQKFLRLRSMFTE